MASDEAQWSRLREEARVLDEQDAFKSFREEFHIPTRAEIKRDRLEAPGTETSDPASGESCVYLVGNSLGLQPRRTATRIQQYLATWATQGVQGHFKPLNDSPLPPWLDVDARAAHMMAPIVGAHPSEVAVMQTLTANLHLLMSAFYRPDPKGRHKIILESKAFPSDHFAVETQIRHHGLDPASSMVLIEPPDPARPALGTAAVQAAVAAHADTAALLLLPGVQYYTGELLDMAAITRFARDRGLVVVWDLAHAVGNVPLALHDWDVDAAAWCSYKYLNGGPGCIGGLFVHERHTGGAGAAAASDSGPPPPPLRRLGGWWGNDKRTRFAMATEAAFAPARGAAGFQLSNPSALDATALCASLELFAAVAGVGALRARSERLTAFLERLLLLALHDDAAPPDRALFRIITPADPARRGAQLSILLAGGLLDSVVAGLAARGVLVDERRPDVIRVAPAPLYNTFDDCVRFVGAFVEALEEARDKGAE